jgi:RNA polymerase sigma-70 factor (ECF subfamily)
MPVTTLPDELVTSIDPVVGRGAADRAAAITARISAFAGAEHVRVVAAVALWSGSVDDAGDAVVDALGRAWEQLEQGKTIDNLAAWVTRVAMNQVRSRHRHLAVVGRKRHLLVAADHPDPSGAAADRLDVARALADLTDRQREVVALRYGLDLGLADIAAQLGIAEGTVKATLHQTRTILAEMLGTPAPGATDD